MRFLKYASMAAFLMLCMGLSNVSQAQWTHGSYSFNDIYLDTTASTNIGTGYVPGANGGSVVATMSNLPSCQGTYDVRFKVTYSWGGSPTAVQDLVLTTTGELQGAGSPQNGYAGAVTARSGVNGPGGILDDGTMGGNYNSVKKQIPFTAVAAGSGTISTTQYIIGTTYLSVQTGNATNSGNAQAFVHF